MKVVVGVVLARFPRKSGGHVCAVMNWILSLRALGWDVWIAEHLESSELEPADPETGLSPQESFWRATAEEFGLADRQCLIIDGKSPDMEAFRDFASGAEMFLNYSGQFRRLEFVEGCKTKCYLDVDPGFTQLWVETCGCDMNYAGHDLFFTLGANFGKPGVVLPPTREEWIALVPPVECDYWRTKLEASGGPDRHGAWSTVAHWYGYNDLVWEGLTYGGKRESLLAAIGLPKLAGVPFAIASDIEPGWPDYEEFLAEGWRHVRSGDVCHDVASYLKFIAGSRGEIGIAKGGYVVSRGGWISDRSVLYLAFGVPVVLQDTGWPDAVPPGPGFLPFADTAEAARRIREIEADYAAHSEGALAFAENIFSPVPALAPLVSRIG